ncbi:hypothetical protein [Desulfosporosinus burensis]
MDKYIIAEIPAAAGFKEKIYRVGALKKTDDKWTVEAPKENDIDKDGKPDWTAEKFACGKCHAPGLENSSDNLSISCESCHGPAGNHASATDKKGTLSRETARTSCMNCHKSDPAKDAQGNFTAHKANANGATLVADKPTEICAKCHAGINFDLDKLMWKNPTDPQGHFTKDHSFGAIKYEDLQDDPATKPVEIKNPTVIELIEKLLPELAK